MLIPNSRLQTQIACRCRWKNPLDSLVVLRSQASLGSPSWESRLMTLSATGQMVRPSSLKCSAALSAFLTKGGEYCPILGVAFSCPSFLHHESSRNFISTYNGTSGTAPSLNLMYYKSVRRSEPESNNLGSFHGGRVLTSTTTPQGRSSPPRHLWYTPAVRAMIAQSVYYHAYSQPLLRVREMRLEVSPQL